MKTKMDMKHSCPEQGVESKRQRAEMKEYKQLNGCTNVLIKAARECETPSCNDRACKFIAPMQCTSRARRAPA